ncbi:MAG: ANTAR domain-containing protein [Nakamurella sp.]
MSANGAVFPSAVTANLVACRVRDIASVRNLLAVLAVLTAPAAAAEPAEPHRSGPDDERNPHADAESAGQLRDELDLLRRVVDARAVIEQAKGMLMAEHRIPADHAFDLLRRRSQNTNTKLRDVAAHHVLLHSGQFRVRQPRP